MRAPGSNELGVGPVTADEVVTEGWRRLTGDVNILAPLTSQHSFDPRNSLYGHRSQAMHYLRSIFKKLTVGGPAVHGLAMGDSTLIGYNGSTYVYDDSIPRKFGQCVAELLGVQYGNGIEQAIKAQGAVGDNTVLTGGFASYVNTYPHLLTGYGTGTAVWTSTEPGTSAEFYYSDVSANGFTYKIDTGSNQTVTTGATNTIKKITVTGLSNRRHTITINGVASNYVFILGWRVFNPNASALYMHNMAIGGSKANSGSTVGLNWSSTTTASGGGLGFTAPATWAAAGITPSFGLISVGNNDVGGGTVPAETIIQGIRNMKAYLPSGCPIILVHPPKVANSDEQVYSALSTQFYSLADELQNCLYFDWNDWASTVGGLQSDSLLGSDGFHPLKAEQLGVARHLANAVTEDQGVRMPGFFDGGFQTASFTAQPGYSYTTFQTPTNSTLTITLPAAPAENTQICVTRQDLNFYAGAKVVFAASGSTDVFDGTTSGGPPQLVQGSVILEYKYGAWRSLSNGMQGMGNYYAPDSIILNTPSIMARDAAGNTEVATPTSASHAANKQYVDGKTSQTMLITLMSANVSPGVPSTWYRNATATAYTVTLPSAPYDGARIIAEGASTGAVTLTCGGSDTFDTGATSTTVNPGDWMEITYRSANLTWYLRRYTSGNTGGTNVRRDGSGRAKFTDPIASDDVMTRGFQDSKALAVLTANVTSSATASTETVLLRAAIPANSPYFTAAGRPLKIRLLGYSSSTGTLTFRVRAGANGTTADTVIWTSTTSAAQAANQRASIDVEGILPSTTTIIAEGEGTAGTAALGTAVAAPAAATIAPTALWYISVTVVCSVASGFVGRMGSIVVN